MTGMTTSYGSKDQIARLLALVPYLHSHQEVRLSEAARMLGVTERQLTKDLKVLWMCGLPGGLPDDLIDVDMDALEEPGGDRIIRIDNADYLARPLKLTPTEATALIVALRALRESAGEETREVVDRALAKLEQAAAAESAPIVHPGQAPDAELAKLELTLAQAIRNGRQVQLTYHVPSRDEESVRIVDPHRLSRAHEAVYLDAWCHSAEAPRWFRIDRIREAHVLEEPISSEAPVRDLVDDLLGSEATVATVELAPEARWITEYYPTGEVRELGDGRVEADLPVAEPRWLVRLALRAAPHVRIIEPAAYDQMYREALTRTRALYADRQ
ncbi:helix-turn-helix transcriptional regulator [Nocardioides sp. Kera G14]|uniref:helix-turn-helix transcriptional regulator n=1 Tax=Nocardioides sp. Kera G14 TaxID=2884264 RepID=UPI001D1041FA|nr:WYL domain-containing protein [Nocardioides sp. Kera G14]UDY25202.1 WYL domain-containing protein [Nocardioides sp. Kera G14]